MFGEKFKQILISCNSLAWWFILRFFLAFAGAVNCYMGDLLIRSTVEGLPVVKLSIFWSNEKRNRACDSFPQKKLLALQHTNFPVLLVDVEYSGKNFQLDETLVPLFMRRGKGWDPQKSYNPQTNHREIHIPRQWGSSAKYMTNSMTNAFQLGRVSFSFWMLNELKKKEIICLAISLN